jgi:hypothetical protein
MRAAARVNMPRHLQQRRLTWESVIYSLTIAVILAVWVLAAVRGA